VRRLVTSANSQEELGSPTALDEAAESDDLSGSAYSSALGLAVPSLWQWLWV
jgi:hypothetical protein